CAQCGTRLGRPCPACGNVCDADAQFCGKCGRPLGAPTAAAVPTRAAARETEGERKQLTVLFADVQGSMELQEDLDVEAWAKIVDRFVSILADGVRRFG